MPTLVLTRKDIHELLDINEVIATIEKVFIDWVQGKAKMPSKVYVSVDKGDFRAMPASLPDAVGLKWVNVHPDNMKKGLPSVMAVLIYNDPVTGYPLAIMDGTEITAYRTGAAAALASKYMAKTEPQTLGLIGAGQQAYTQLMAHIALFTFKKIKVYDIRKAAVEKFINSFPELNIKESTLEETAASDIVCIQTTSRAPVLKEKMISPGTHINAIGADARGKQELDSTLVLKSNVVVDDIQQASRSGEINVPISKGICKLDDIYATLGEVITGKKPGRMEDEAITIFDSTGVAIEDIAVSHLIYQKAIKSGNYLSVNLVEQ